MKVDDSIFSIRSIEERKLKVLCNELRIKTILDLLEYFPYKYVNTRKVSLISEINHDLVGSVVVLNGTIKSIGIVTTSRNKKYLEAILTDKSGDVVHLVWFKGTEQVAKVFLCGHSYSISGELSMFRDVYTIIHPSISKTACRQGIIACYPMTDVLLRHSMNDSFFRQLIQNVLYELDGIPEVIPQTLCDRYKLMDRMMSFREVHMPTSRRSLDSARRRLKFEELFAIQYKLYKSRKSRVESVGHIMRDVSIVKIFCNNLPFQLTNAQKRVIREIYRNMCSGHKMNRLLQGDVGSGKTIVAFISMLIAISNGFQAAIMVPTEVLAEQHYRKIVKLSKGLNIVVVLLTGSTTSSNRRRIMELLHSGTVNVVIGTHTLINDAIQYKKLGLVIIDEQHKFGVLQRHTFTSSNGQDIQPHILLMTATPIPRTLAMTLYVDYDVSTIDELPNGRKGIKTIHFYEFSRLKMFGFVKQQIDTGHQVYFVYPLIEESSKMDLKNLIDGYKALSRSFPDVSISILHGGMQPKDKEFEMDRFLRGETKIMVATTVIEVGVDVPNATVMVIENAERFGLSQLHQLRGRVGRGGDESYCILMTGVKLSKQSKERIDAMIKYSDGVTISTIDMKIRGFGDVFGEAQSGYLKMKIADINSDYEMMTVIKDEIEKLDSEDT